MSDTFDPDLGLDPALVARYLAGECTREEAQRFERWLAEHPEQAAAVEELRETRRIASGLNPESYDIDAEWDKLWRRKDIAPRAERPPLRLTVNRRPTPFEIARRVAIAAVVVLAVGAGAWFVLGDRVGVRGPVAPAPLREIVTRPGQRADVYLSDGTHVVLGAASRLRFSAPLGRASRDVYLDGEALFDVTHQAEWPFVVHTPRGIAEDLGTKFSIRAYAADSVVTVAVAEGKVALRRDTAAGTPNAAVLERGDLGTITADGRVGAERGVALEPYLAWAEGRLVFSDTPLRDALPQLARWYDVELRLADPSLASRRLTAAFATTSADELVRYLAIALGLRYERQGRVVTFYPMSLDADR